MRYIAWIAVLCVSLVGFLACGGTDPACEGRQGCACDDARPCDKGLVCAQGSCQAPANEASPELHPADGGSDAGPVDDAPRCVQGSLGCRCLASGKCNDGLRCDNGTCQTCPKGTAGCACGDGNQCETGLKCEAGVCKGCIGKAFCPCFGNNSCEPGNKCQLQDNGVTTCQSCQDIADKKDCNCTSDNDCGDGLLCINSRCLDPSVMKKIPTKPRCYTTCEGDEKMSDGTIRTCHPTYRLMEGCLVTQTCMEGSCVSASLSNKNQLDSKDYPFCLKDNDCPLWQTCIGGRCYSNCTNDSECIDGFTCHSYVCRRKCTLQQSTCDSGKSKTNCQVCGKEQVCQSVGSTENEGVCLPLAVRQISHTEPGRTKTQEVFVLGARELSCSNLSPNNDLVIENKSSFAISLEITRSNDTTGNKNPLSWVKIDACKTYNAERTACQAFANQPTSQDPFKVDVPALSIVVLRIQNTDKGPSSVDAYQGTFRVRSQETEQLFTLSYRKSGTGRWKGKIFSMGNFEADNIEKIKSSTNVRDFPNAFIRRWLNFKSNSLTFDQFRAILLAMQSETWRLPQVRSDCTKLFSQQATSDVICYPYSSKNGYEVLSISNKEAPIPTGISALTFTMDVKEGANNTWQGRIVTSETLQYPGDPQISLAFDAQPGSKDKTYLKTLSATIDMGGRYHVQSSESCTSAGSLNFPKSTLPWLLLDFVGLSEQITGLFRERYECRQKNTPRTIPAGASKQVIATIESQNQSLSGANPIPSGRVLRRQIELVDGVLYKNNILFAIVRERLSSPFAGSGSGNTNSLFEKDWVRYGYILLERTNYTLQAKDTQGNAPTVCKGNADCSGGELCKQGICSIPSQLQQVTCSSDVVYTAVNRSIRTSSDLDNWSSAQLSDLVYSLIFGQTKANLSNVQSIRGVTKDDLTTYSYRNNQSGQLHYIHYLCVDTKQFNGGPVDNPVSCPKDSKVIFFELQDVDEKTLRDDPCQKKQTCDQRYDQLKSNPGFRENVPFKCASANVAVCDGSNRKDVREDKQFFPPASSVSSGYLSPYLPLRDAIRRAFLYRTKFQSRDGKSVGFAPQLCSATAPSSTPYCYDAKAIEQVEQRVNCLEYLFTHTTTHNRMDNDARGQLRAFLVHAFGYQNAKSVSGAILTDVGFETLNAELRVMLGDEAYVKALGSRYDLAQSNAISFAGSKLEPNGVDLSGVLGSEMHYLYRSVQYYQSVLDRFYSQTSALSISLTSSSSSFLTAETVTSYIQKLLLAATRKARSWSQIARKYHGLQRRDLAQHVLERAYISSYLEQVILTYLLSELTRVIQRQSLPQVRQSIETITKTYNAALLDMQETYEKISREMDSFGFPAGYIPLPALDSFSSSSNRQTAFSVTLPFVKQKLESAREKEDIALHSSRSFDTSAAQFQSELVKIETNYNEQLIQLCGALQDGDRQVPAIPRYAALLPASLKEGNPCGKVKGSLIYDAYLNLEKVSLNTLQLDAQRKALFARIDDEKERIRKTCNDRFDLSDITWDYLDQKKDLQFTRSTTDLIIQSAIRAGMGAVQIATGWKCEELFGGALKGGSCANAKFSNLSKIAILLAQEAATAYLTIKKIDKEKELTSLNANFAKFQVQTTCNICEKDDPSKCTAGVARIASQNYIAQITLQTHMLQYRALLTEYDIRLAAAQVEQLKQQAQRLIQEQNDALSMLTEVTSAANDPNQRIYKNDAVLSAERTFQEALHEAYRLTLIYEYYTGTSYARKSDLFLVRMVSSGDISLETYLSQLEQAYRDFEESNGRSDLRVVVLSMKNDIVKIPRLDADGKPYTAEQRAKLFRQALENRDNFNGDGYLRFVFSLSVDAKSQYVSPVTYNHKIAYIEAEIQGTDVGDDGIGRIYLRQSGTGVVRTASDNFNYYSLPQRTAVINTYFNGTKLFTPEIYQNYRLQDRPLGNTQWELMFNQVNETANQDINLSSISDVVLYVYYRDFSKK